MTPDPYHDFAQRYDLFYDELGRREPGYEAFFRILFARHRVRSVLDCACGTGRDLHLFHSLGYQVHGSDISEAMLAKARENLASAGIQVLLKKVDFRELPRHYEGNFDAVVCLSTSLPHMLEENDVLRALSSMRKVLQDKGILLLSQGICDRQLRERPRFIPVVNTDDFSRVFAMEYLDDLLRIHVLDLFHGDGKNDFKVSSFDYRVILQDDYRRLLSLAGFVQTHFYGTYRFDPYDREQSQRLIVVATA